MMAISDGEILVILTGFV